MIRFFLEFLVSELEVRRDVVRLDLHLFPDHADDQRRIETHWLTVLDLPETCLRSSTINVYSPYSQKKRRNRLPFGTCRLAVDSTALVQHIFGAIQEYGRFDRPSWLD